MQLPPLQVPEEPKVRRVVLLRQAAAGGWLQLTPWHGSFVHAPLAQPKGQVVCEGA